MGDGDATGGDATGGGPTDGGPTDGGPTDGPSGDGGLGAQTQCNLTPMVVNCGCVGSGCANDWHPVAECGNSSNYSPGAQFASLLECYPQGKSMSKGLSKDCPEEDIIIVDEETIPDVTDPKDIENCEKIAAQLDDPDFQAKVQVLKDNYNGDGEKSFCEYVDGTFADGAVSEDGHEARPPIGINAIGSAHNHLNDKELPDYNGDGVIDIEYRIRYHSPKDINQFIRLLKWADARGRPLSDVYQNMYSSSGSYTLKFSGDIDDISILTTTEVDDLILDYKEFMGLKGSLKKLLLFMKNNMDIPGVDLFKIQNNGTVKKYSLDQNNKVKPEKC